MVSAKLLYCSAIFLSPPAVTVEAAEINGLAQMFGGDIGAGIEVGDGTSHLEDAVVGAGGETKPIHRLLHQCLAPFVNRTVLVE